MYRGKKQSRYAATARIKNKESGVSFNKHGGIEIAPNVTLEDVEEFCDINEPLSENAKYAIFCGAIDHLHSLNLSDRNATYISIMHFICSKGFDVNEIHFGGIYGNTILLWDISSGRDVSPRASLTLLCDFSANPFITDKVGKNALHFLLLKGHDVQRCIVDEILNHRDIEKYINDKTICGDTALHIACARRDERFIIQLLEKGANPWIKNKYNKTPIDMLGLDEQKRLGVLSLRLNLRPATKYDIGPILFFINSTDGFYTIDPADKFKDVATIDQKIFNSDSNTIAAKIKKMRKAAVKEKVLQDPVVFQAIERSNLRQR
ncbi:ankyrin repeat domain-containing protein [Candidatus Mesenet endosymbiont of Agriotes lineatus]|uniref:ankyrin repeat domain-containing protein n=1 Tax=Candidatus Mesenet endosymbiont of Agriotes lineatus TaxID=3077948 RepID=UPI0030CFC7F7